VNVVDSSGWLEYLADGPNAPFFAPAVEDAARLVVPAISLYEVFRHVLVRSGEGKALQAIAFLHRGRILPLYGDLALEAARLGVEHRLPLADATMLASARSAGAVLWTQDSDFEGIAGVRFPATRRG
jgi:predicted nucleic acid-binding protein